MTGNDNHYVKFKNLIPMKEDIATLKSDVSYLKKDVKDIKDNDLHDIKKKLDDLQKWQIKVATALAIIVFLITLFGDKISNLIFK